MNATRIQKIRWLPALALAGVACLGQTVHPAHAFEERVFEVGGCEGGAKKIGYIGISGLECNCIYYEDEDGPHAWQFRSEPKILNIEERSPASGKLRAGDTIIAINDDLITTKRAGQLFARPYPLEPIELTIRRDGRTLVKWIVPEAVCPDDPRLHGGAPQASESGLGYSSLSPPTVSSAPHPPLDYDRALSAYAKALESALGDAPPAVDDVDLLPPGWLGIGIQCSDCGIQQSENGRTEWYFASPPEVYSVDEGSPADRGGLRRGDILTHIGGVALDTDAGSARFSNIQSGEEITWTIKRKGREHVVHTTAQTPLIPRLPKAPSHITPGGVSGSEPSISPTPPTSGAFSAPPVPVSETENRLRFNGTLGGTDVEVWGLSSVVVTMDQGEIVIKTGTATIRLKVNASRRSNN